MWGRAGVAITACKGCALQSLWRSNPVPREGRDACGRAAGDAMVARHCESASAANCVSLCSCCDPATAVNGTLPSTSSYITRPSVPNTVQNDSNSRPMDSSDGFEGFSTPSTQSKSQPPQQQDTRSNGQKSPRPTDVRATCSSVAATRYFSTQNQKCMRNSCDAYSSRYGAPWRACAMYSL